jgi:large subunit ribosomal protein L27
MGTDHTLFAKIEGHVEFHVKAKGRTLVSVRPMTDVAAE